MTNFERIKAMSVGELVEMLGYSCLCSHIQYYERKWCEAHSNCDKCMWEWLESEAQDG